MWSQCHSLTYRRVVLAVLGIILVLSLLVYGCNGSTQTADDDVGDDATDGADGVGEAAPVVGSPAPDFTLVDVDGNTVRLSDLRGKVVFLNFWSTWCSPCRDEMPEMEKLYQEYKDRDLVIIGVDLRESRGDIKQFVEDTGYSWTFVIDTTGAVSQEYMVEYIPASFFIDKDGIIRATQVGSMSKTTMEAKLAEAME